MLHIAGGSYYEFCSETNWNQLFGSGLRAAAAISGLTKSPILHTYISERDRDNLEANAASFDVTVSATQTDRTVRFQYLHGLARPEITPPISTIQQAKPIAVDGPAILRFGFLEGGAIVNGDRVVYDPQSPQNPRHFAENGSKAKHLAIVTNAHESYMLTQRESVDEAAQVLLKDHGADVVVIKQGSLGALVVTRHGADRVPAFKTKRVWPIGSGDVFSGVFAHYWAEEQRDAVTAAKKASAAAAYYCNHVSLPLPEDFEQQVHKEFPPIQARTAGKSETPLIYLAGPFFTTAERWLVNELRAALLGQRLHVFSPLHEVGHGAAKDVVPKDIDALKKCDAVLAIVDGTDAGTLFEVGYARAINKPVVAFVQNEHDEALKMLEGTDCEITNDLVTAVYRTAWAALRI